MNKLRNTILLLMVLLLGSCTMDDPSGLPQERKRGIQGEIQVSHIEYNNHQYIGFWWPLSGRHDKFSGWVHDPDCKCKIEHGKDSLDNR